MLANTVETISPVGDKTPMKPNPPRTSDLNAGQLVQALSGADSSASLLTNQVPDVIMDTVSEQAERVRLFEEEYPSSS